MKWKGNMKGLCHDMEEISLITFKHYSFPWIPANLRIRFEIIRALYNLLLILKK